MAKYQQASRTHLIRTEPFKLVKDISEPADIAVPFYLAQWTPNDKMKFGENAVVCNTELTFQLDLNNLFVSWENGYGYKKGHLDFRDERSGHQVFIRLEAITETAVSYSQIGTDEVFYGVDYRIQSTAFEQKPFRHEYHGMAQTAKHFFNVEDLGNRGIYKIGNNEFSMGLRSRQWKISYRSKLLSGKCYALLCGTWAILLDDDLKFDALVILNGVNPYQLSVEKFVYTTNPYILKAMMLLK